MLEIRAMVDLKQHHEKLLSWARVAVAIWTVRILLVGWSLVGQQIVIRPEFGVAGMFESIVGIPAELYGWWMVLIPLIGVMGKPTRDKMLVAQIPAWLHLGFTMIYSHFEAGGNWFALPFPTYASICITLFLLAQVVDD